MADNKSREVGKLQVKVEVDVSEALTGLKALQREAREATKAIRELESAQKILERLERIEREPDSAIPWREVRKGGAVGDAE